MKTKEVTDMVSNLLDSFGKRFDAGDAEVCIDTCDTTSYGWDPVKHRAMQMLKAGGIKDCVIEHRYRFEVNEWVVKKIIVAPKGGYSCT